VLALLAWEGQPEPDQAARAFDTGMRGYIGGDHTHRLPPRDECSLAEFDAAMQTLTQSVPAIKRRIVVASAACILAKQTITLPDNTPRTPVPGRPRPLPNERAPAAKAKCPPAFGDPSDSPLPPLVVGEAEGRCLSIFASCARSEPLFVTSCAMMRCARFPPRL